MGFPLAHTVTTSTGAEAQAEEVEAGGAARATHFRGLARSAFDFRPPSLIEGDRIFK